MNNNTIFIVIAIVTGEGNMLYYKNKSLIFVWFVLIFIQLIKKFISICPESSHSDKQQHHSTELASYNLATAKRRYCIKGHPIIVCEFVTCM